MIKYFNIGAPGICLDARTLLSFTIFRIVPQGWILGQSPRTRNYMNNLQRYNSRRSVHLSGLPDSVKMTLNLINFVSNVNNNPFINAFAKKILEQVSNNPSNKQFQEYVLNRIEINRIELIKQNGLFDLINGNKSIIFSTHCPEGFSEMFKYSKQSGIYKFDSILHTDMSYVGSTINLYKRLYNQKKYSISDVKTHPKFYNYVNKYGWEQLQIKVLTLLPNHKKDFENLYPNITLNPSIIEVLENLTRYELLITEQFCIDVYKPKLNISTIVNFGGLPNRGSTGYTLSEEDKAKRSSNIIGRTFSAKTIELIRYKITGKILSAETRLKMSASHGGVKVFVYSKDYYKKEEYPTKTIAATALNISIRTLDRRCKDGKPLFINNNKVIVSYDPNLSKF